ncbi:MAG: hypothetical protein LUC43_07645 [Burkholderiales bacterium]|nr:hypothetical protein [Burkholderiales bacterium]
MGTKIRGFSDHLIYLKGDIEDEIDIPEAGSGKSQGVLLEFSDGTKLEVSYGKPDLPQSWQIKVLNKGDLFGEFDGCETEEEDNYSDIVWLKDGVEWGKYKLNAESDWKYLKVHTPYLDGTGAVDHKEKRGTRIYGSSADFVEIDGEIEDEISCWDSEKEFHPGIFIVFSDGTILRFKKGLRGQSKVWDAEILKKGPLFGVHLIADQTNHGNSDVVWMKEGIKWASSSYSLGDNHYERLRRYMPYPAEEDN